MSRTRSPALIRAIDMVTSGSTVYAAAKATGLCQSTISRAIKPPVKQRCPCCGKPATKKTTG